MIENCTWTILKKKRKKKEIAVTKIFQGGRKFSGFGKYLALYGLESMNRWPDIH